MITKEKTSKNLIPLTITEYCAVVYPERTRQCILLRLGEGLEINGAEEIGKMGGQWILHVSRETLRKWPLEKALWNDIKPVAKMKYGGLFIEDPGIIKKVTEFLRMTVLSPKAEKKVGGKSPKSQITIRPQEKDIVTSSFRSQLREKKTGVK